MSFLAFRGFLNGDHVFTEIQHFLVPEAIFPQYTYNIRILFVKSLKLMHNFLVNWRP